MAGRKRRRPGTGAARQEAQRQAAAERRRQEAELTTNALSFLQASVASGIDKYRIGTVIKRAGVPVYRSPADARKKFIKREDLPRLTGLMPAEPPAPPKAPDAGPEAAQ